MSQIKSRQNDVIFINCNEANCLVSPKLAFPSARNTLGSYSLALKSIAFDVEYFVRYSTSCLACWPCDRPIGLEKFEAQGKIKKRMAGSIMSTHIPNFFPDTYYMSWFFPKLVKEEMYEYFYSIEGQRWSVGNYWKGKS